MLPASAHLEGALAAGGARALLDEDRVLVLHGVTWGRYVAVRELFDEIPGLRMTFLAGTLEIMSPSKRHEREKKLLARLIEVYALDRGIDLVSMGSTTFRSEPQERGLEPDECYGIGDDDRDLPDFAIEVDVSRTTIDKLEVYRGLSVPEVWIWKDGAIELHQLREGRYVRGERSRFLPDLDLALLAELARADLKQTEAVRQFRERAR